MQAVLTSLIADKGSPGLWALGNIIHQRAGVDNVSATEMRFSIITFGQLGVYLRVVLSPVIIKALPFI